MILNDFVNALHEDEKELARKYKDEKGTDWDKFILEKEKAGFGKLWTGEWQFMDYSHVTTQLKSKYTTKWGTRMVGVMINDRKIDIQFFVAGSGRAQKDCHYNLYKQLHGTESKHDAMNGSENGKKLVQEFLAPYQAVGHGINFSAPIEVNEERKPELVKMCEEKGAYKPGAFTAIWNTHNLMVLVIHEGRHLVDAE